MPIDGWLTTTEVAAVLQIHPKHVYRLIKKGLPAHRVGGQWRFLSEEILEWSSPTKRTGVSAEDIHQVDNAAPVLATEGGIILDAARALLNRCGCQFACVTASPSELPRLIEEGLAQAAIVLDTAPIWFPTLRIKLMELSYGIVGNPTGKKPFAAPAPDSFAGMELGRTRDHACDRTTARVTKLMLDHANKARSLGTEEQCVFAVARGDASATFSCGVWAERLGLPFTPTQTTSLVLAIPTEGEGIRNLEHLLATGTDRRGLLDSNYASTCRFEMRYESASTIPNVHELPPRHPRSHGSTRWVFYNAAGHMTWREWLNSFAKETSEWEGSCRCRVVRRIA